MVGKSVVVLGIYCFLYLFGCVLSFNISVFGLVLGFFPLFSPSSGWLGVIGFSRLWFFEDSL